MRTSRRFGALAASAVLGGSALVGIAGPAAAAPNERVVDGPSALEVELDGAGELRLSYDNQSSQDLICIAFVTTGEVAAGLFEHFAFGEFDAPLPEHLADTLDEAEADGLVAVTLFASPAEGPDPLVNTISGEYDFADDWPVAVSQCSSASYREVEMSASYPPGSAGLAVLDSPSVLTVTGRGSETTVQYKNESGRDLNCVAMVGDPTLISEIFAAIESDPATAGVLDEELRVALESAAQSGTVGTYGGGIDDGASTALAAITENIDPAGVLTDDSFDPVGLSFCSLFAGENTYTEVEISRTDFDDDDDNPTGLLGDPIVDSPSALTIAPSPLLEGGFAYSYDNRSGVDLFCTVFLGSQEYVAGQLSRIDKQGLVVTDVTWLPSSAEGGDAGWFVSRAGTSGPVSTLPVTGPGSTETEPHAVSFCVEVELNGSNLVAITGDHFEIETTTYDSAGDDDNEAPGPGMNVPDMIAGLIEAIDVFGSIGPEN